MSIYKFSLEKANGELRSLEDFKGKVLLIVNTAIKCGFTPQYEELQNLYDKYSSNGLEIIDIPSNQFKDQAPGSDEEIATFCQLNFGTKFEQYHKSDVNGENEIPLYTYLKSKKGYEGMGNSPKELSMKALYLTRDKNYMNNPDIKWNFTKFLVDREGTVVKRFEPTEKIGKIEEKILELL